MPPLLSTTEERAAAAFAALDKALHAANAAMFDLATEHGAQHVENAHWFFNVKPEAKVLDRMYPKQAEKDRWYNLCAAVVAAADRNKEDA